MASRLGMCTMDVANWKTNQNQEEVSPQTQILPAVQSWKISVGKDVGKETTLKEEMPGKIAFVENIPRCVSFVACFLLRQDFHCVAQPTPDPQPSCLIFQFTGPCCFNRKCPSLCGCKDLNGEIRERRRPRGACCAPAQQWTITTLPRHLAGL